MSSLYRIGFVLSIVLLLVASTFALGPSGGVSSDTSGSFLAKSVSLIPLSAYATSTGAGIREAMNSTGVNVSSCVTPVIAPKKAEVPKSTGIVCFKTDVTYDMMSDASYTRFVSPDCELVNTSYVPSDLVALKTTKSLLLKKSSILLRKDAAAALNKLSVAFNRDMKTPLKIVSGYRSFEYQNGMVNRGCDLKYCAKPGRSEHQLGLAVDIFEATSNKAFLSNAGNRKRHDWMVAHAAEYGFTESYQFGPTIDGYEKEPWHWRYVGIDLARDLSSKKISFGKWMRE